MTEKEKIVKELKKSIQEAKEKIFKMDNSITASYMCANDYPLRRSKFEEMAHKEERERDALKAKVLWKETVLKKYNCN